MIVSEKQRDANRRNAEHSTGPKTPEGKAAVRLNALTYGLRARSTLIPGEDPEEYKQLWDDLVAEWQPQTRTERMQLEQMAASQWLLARVARGESQIYAADLGIKQQFVLLEYASTQRLRLERSFASALRQLKELQKERQARQRQTAQTAQTAHAPVPPPPAPPPGPRPLGAPIAPDTR